MEATKPTLKEALDDVETRFLYNLPKSELEQSDRLFFQIEQAHWYYEDFKADVYPHLPHFKRFETFATKLFEHSALLSKLGDKFRDLVQRFKNYKSHIPVCGAILLNPEMTKMALTKVYKSDCWTFPRGKINENEAEHACAIREVYEETGYDSTDNLNENDYLMDMLGEKPIKLFIVCNVPENTLFEPQTRKEVDEVSFFPFHKLPKTFCVLQFVNSLQNWVKRKQHQLQRNKKLLKSPPLVPMSVKTAAMSNGGRRSASVAKVTSATATLTFAALLAGAANSTINKQRNTTPGGSVAILAKPKEIKSPLLVAQNSKARAVSVGKKKATANPSPATVKRLSNVFDLRNNDTFDMEEDLLGGGKRSGSNPVKRWGVDDMFAANSKLTGKNYVYDGNPHNFGCAHPRFVDYRQMSGAAASRSLLEKEGEGESSTSEQQQSSPTSAQFLFNIPIRYSSTGTTTPGTTGPASTSKPVTKKATNQSQQSDADDENSDENNPFRAWSEQSVKNHSMLRANIHLEDEEAAIRAMYGQAAQTAAANKAKAAEAQAQAIASEAASAATTKSKNGKKKNKKEDAVPATPPHNLTKKGEIEVMNSPLRDFSLPQSSFAFPVHVGGSGMGGGHKDASRRHDSFDSSIGGGGVTEGEESGVEESAEQHRRLQQQSALKKAAVAAAADKKKKTVTILPAPDAITAAALASADQELRDLHDEFRLGQKIVFPVKFTLNKAAIMKRYDQAFLRGTTA